MQAQMTPATAPGIAGLMRGMPQGKPPTPQPQQGAQPQGLNAIDPRTMQALGLQKALQKAEMEAASLRQQAMNQQTPQMSVAEQNLQKLAALEAEKMAPPSAQNQAPIVAGASQQRDQQEKAAMGRLMAMASQGGPQGVRNLPGSGNVVPPQGMAGGGIVAFQEGGEAPSAVDQREVQRILRKSPMMRTPEENAILRQAGLKLEQRQMGPEGIIQRAERGLQQVGPAARQYLTEGAQGLSPEDLEQRSDAGAVTEKLYRMLGGQQARPPVQPDTMQAEEQRLLGRFPAPQMPEPPQAPPLAEQRPPAPPMSPSGPGIRGLGAAPLKPQGVGQGITVPQGSALPQGMQQIPEQGPMTTQELLKQSGIDEESRAASAMERARAALGATPEEKAYFEERLARLQKPEPEKRWYERLAEFAPYLGQQRIQPGQQGIIGGLGRIASAGAQMGQAQKTAADQRQAQIDALRKEQMERARAERGDIFKMGEQARTGAREERLATGKLGVDLAGQAAQDRRTLAQIRSQEGTVAAQIASAERIALQRVNAPTEMSEKIRLFKNDPATYRAMFTKPEKDLAFSALKEQADILTKQLTGPIPPSGKDKERLESELGKINQALSQISGVGGVAPRTMTMADVRATAKARGVSEQEVMNRAKAAGYAIQ